jgi:Flp pilus assembly pilin Flp
MIKRILTKQVDKLIAKIYDEEHGGELVETALLLGFIVIAALGIMSKIGLKIFSQWITIRDIM